MMTEQPTDLMSRGSAGVQQARLARYGIVSVSGADARAFLHAQLTNDIEHLGSDSARLAGWCSAKGRLLANFAVVPRGEGFLLVMARDLAAAIAKRLTMFVLRSKVRVADESDAWARTGVWGAGARTRLGELGLAPAERPLSVAAAGGRVAVRVDSDRFLVIAPAEEAQALEAGIGGRIVPDDEWSLLEIRSGRVLITQATQDQFVPQMVAFEAIGGVDFKKGCYPGQEVVARAQYRGQLKRGILRARVPSGIELHPGQDLYSDDGAEQASGTIVNVAPAPDGSELLAVAPIAAIEEHKPIRTAPGGARIEVLALPYSR